MSDVIISILWIMLFLAIGFGMIIVMCENTETFRAIDEKIARLIKGADDE